MTADGKHDQAKQKYSIGVDGKPIQFRQVPEPFKEAPENPRPPLDGKQLQKKRELRGWSQAQLAQMLGVTVSKVQEWENTKFYVEAHRRLKLAELLGEDIYRTFDQSDSVEVGNQGMQQSIQIFFCYAHEDEELLNKLKAHLRPLERQGLIDVWHDRDISAGTEWEQEIKKHINEADIILLLVSPDFMNSDYCYSIEMNQALERHQRGEVKVIPIIVRPVYWQGILGNIQVLPMVYS